MGYTAADVKAIREKAGLSQQAFGVRIGLTREMVNKIENGQKPISRGTELSIKQFVEVSEQISHDEEMLSKRGKKEVIPLGKKVQLRLKPEEFADAFPDWQGLPVYNQPISASFVEHYQDETTYSPLYYLRDPRFKDCNFAAIITGDSMHSEIRHGDYVACQEIVDKSFIVMGDIYYIVAKNGLETCKYVNADPDDRDSYMLVPKNANISPTPIKKKMINKIYKVKGLIRGY